MDLEIAPLFPSSIISAGLALGVAYMMLKSYRVTQREYLLGLPIGFSFLALSYLFLVASTAVPPMKDIVRWLDLFSNAREDTTLVDESHRLRRTSGSSLNCSGTLVARN